MIDSSPGMQAYYAIPVRQASVLPPASFRFHLTMDTLAARLMVPLNGPIVNFHHQVVAPCRAHNYKGCAVDRAPGLLAQYDEAKKLLGEDK